MNALNVGPELVKRFQRLKSDRSSFESWWQDTADFVIPRKGQITSSRNPGTRQDDRIVDDSPGFYLHVLAAGLNTFLTSQVNRWFDLRTRNDALMKIHSVKEWLDDVEDSMYSCFNATNAPLEIYEMYEDLGSFGTSILWIGEGSMRGRSKDLAVFRAIPVSECALAENADGFVDTVFRDITMTARQAIQTWDEGKLSQEIREAGEKEPDKPFQFLHVVMPREEVKGQAYRPKLAKPWASYYIDQKIKSVIDEGGFDEMPFITCRWLKSSGEIYGRSPAMTSLREVRMLNRMRETVIRAGEKVVDPPLNVPDDGVMGRIRINPGAINYIRTATMVAGGAPSPMASTARVDIGIELVKDSDAKIQRAFFVDLFLTLMQEGPQMTATEVMQRMDEKMAVLGPVLGRLQFEFLRPMIDRVFGILYRSGEIMDPPEELAGEEIDVEYVSPLVRAQKSYESRAIERTIGSIGPLAQLDPGILDNFDMDKTAMYMADLYGYPERLKRSEDDIAQMRKDRAEQQHAQQQGQDALAVAQAAGQAAPALKLMQGGMGGQGAKPMAQVA